LLGDAVADAASGADAAAAGEFATALAVQMEVDIAMTKGTDATNPTTLSFFTVAPNC
jgi:hypothetical protein